MRALWAAGMLLRRLRTERAIVLLIVVLVTATSFAFAAAPRLFNRVSDDALRYAIQVATPVQRDLTLDLVSSITPGTAGGVSGVRAHGDQLTSQIPPSVRNLVTTRTMRITTVRFVLLNPPSYETHLQLSYQDGLTDATRLVAGRWPVDLGVPLTQQPPGLPSPGATEPPPVVFEIALSTTTATDIGAKVGDRYSMQLDGSDALTRRATVNPVDVVVVGLYEPLDANDPYWSGAPALLQEEQHGDPDHQIAWATAYVPAETYPDLWQSGLLFHYDWRFQVDSAKVDADQVTQLQTDLHRLSLIAASAGTQFGTVAVVTGLPGLFDRYAAQRSLAESVLSIAALGPFGLAAGALAMVAILLVRRRRATLALTRGRGASGALVLGTQAWEAILLAGGAALVGLLIATLVVPSRPSQLSIQLAIGIGAAAVLLLVGASWSVARGQLGQLERDDPPLVRVPPRRLVIELTIVGVAVAAALLLRQRGLAVSSPSGVAQVDPLLAAVPVLTGLAAGILAIRLYPLPVRALGWLAARRRDIVPVLGLRTISRQPAAANLPLLVMLLTAAFGTFSSVIASSLERGQLAASYLNTGADYRIEKIGIGALASTHVVGQVAGVQEVAGGIVDPIASFVGAPNQRASIDLETIDPAAYLAVTRDTPADPAWPDVFLADPAGPGLGTDANPIPALLSARLPTGTADLQPGATFQVQVLDRMLTFRLVERRATFPGVAAGVAFAIAPFNWVQAAFGTSRVTPSILWLRAPGGLEPALAAATKTGGDEARVVSRYTGYAALRDAPFAAVIETGYGLALIAAAVYMALTIIGAVILSDARRTRDQAYLRTLGVTRSQTLALTVMEHAPPVLIALIPGILLGVAVAALCQPGLGLATFVGATGVPLFVDWTTLGVMAAALVAVVALAVAAGTWLSSRARVTQALRMDED